MVIIGNSDRHAGEARELAIEGQESKKKSARRDPMGYKRH
jgi:hypothetical protein